jgi:hypothetical protein
MCKEEAIGSASISTPSKDEEIFWKHLEELKEKAPTRDPFLITALGTSGLGLSELNQDAPSGIALAVPHQPYLSILESELEGRGGGGGEISEYRNQIAQTKY